MFLNNLLEVSEEATDTVKWISIGAVVVLLIVIALICIKNRGKGYDAHHIAAAGVTIALSFALSFIKVSPVTYGGSITLASFVPILIYAYIYGVADGLLTGLIFGLLNFISGPYILTPMTFILDYLLAFASIGVMGLAKKIPLKQPAQVTIGTVAVYIVRFLFHFVSGIIYFQNGAIWVEFPDWAVSGAAVYSFIYQCCYLPADCAIAAIVMFVLAKTKVLDKLVKIVTPRKKKAAEADIETEETESAAEEQNEIK